MHGPRRWSAWSSKAPRNGSFPARSFRATASRALWPSPMAQAPFPPSSDCTAAPGCMTRPGKGWPMSSSPGAMSSCWSTAMRRVVSITPAHRARLPPSSGAGRMPTGLSVFLARQTFVDPHRVAAVGFSAGAWVTLSVAEPNSFELFVPAGNLRFRAAAAFYPPCKQAMARPAIPTLVFIGALDDWTPAADCSSKIAGWGNDGPPSSSLSIPARTMDSITRTFSPARPCLVTGWNTTARPRTMHATACTSFSIATSTEGGANAIELVERNTGRVTHRAYRRRSVSKHGHRLGARGHPSTRAALWAARLRMRFRKRPAPRRPSPRPYRPP